MIRDWAPAMESGTMGFSARFPLLLKRLRYPYDEDYLCTIN
jgi:hypothetical protein